MSLGMCEAHTPRLKCVSKRDGGGFPSSLCLSVTLGERVLQSLGVGEAHTPRLECMHQKVKGWRWISILSLFLCNFGERVLQSPKIVWQRERHNWTKYIDAYFCIIIVWELMFMMVKGLTH